jgi:hypothetical protein
VSANAQICSESSRHRTHFSPDERKLTISLIYLRFTETIGFPTILPICSRWDEKQERYTVDRSIHIPARWTLPVAPAITNGQPPRVCRWYFFNQLRVHLKDSLNGWTQCMMQGLGQVGPLNWEMSLFISQLIEWGPISPRGT